MIIWKPSFSIYWAHFRGYWKRLWVQSLFQYHIKWGPVYTSEKPSSELAWNEYLTWHGDSQFTWYWWHPQQMKISDFFLFSIEINTIWELLIKKERTTSVSLQLQQQHQPWQNSSNSSCSCNLISRQIKFKASRSQIVLQDNGLVEVKVSR